MANEKSLKGWLVIVVGDERFDCVAAARTRAQAVAQSHAASKEAGYRHPWQSFRATRKPEADVWAIGCAQPCIVGASHFSEHCV